MKKIFFFNSLFFISIQIFGQSPGPAYNPMTANGAIGINLSGHSLIWMNPLNVDYNEVYFSEDSALVAYLDPSVKILNGFPSTVYNS
ncbi:MAG TPA: hypothetical protein VIY47_10300, partial [Ignavibacteriaceae bacterium]